MHTPAGPQREDGQHLFGRDAAGYARFRPGYPEALWQQLAAYRPADGAHFEIGPGTGLATARLLAAGSRLTAIEPDPVLAAHLQAAQAPAIAGQRLQVVPARFDALPDPTPGFDAGHAATSFHWLDTAPALAQVRRWLRPGGAWAMWWNVFGDPRAPDAFARATADLFAALAPNPSRIHGLPFALHTEQRLAQLRAAGFTALAQHTLHWQLPQTTEQVLGLTATFSPVACLPTDHRHAFLDRLAERVERVFAGRVERSVLTPLYLARVP